MSKHEDIYFLFNLVVRAFPTNAHFTSHSKQKSRVDLILERS